MEKLAGQHHVKYVFWMHYQAGDNFYDHPVARIEKILQADAKKGRKFQVMGFEAADVPYAERRKFEKEFNSTIEIAKARYEKLLKNHGEKFATNQLYSVIRFMTSMPIAMDTSGLLVLCAKYGLRARLIEAYSAGKIAAILESHRTAVKGDALVSASNYVWARDLLGARASLSKDYGKYGEALLYRHKRILQNIKVILNSESKQAGSESINCIVPIGFWHYPLITMHESALPKVGFSFDTAGEHREIVKHPYAMHHFYAGKYTARISAGKQARLREISKSALSLAIFQDSMNEKMAGWERASDFFARKARNVRNAERLVKRCTEEDFQAIAKRYAETNLPAHQVLAEHFAKK